LLISTVVLPAAPLSSFGSSSSPSSQIILPSLWR
jgi:hypothetical protein